MGLKDKLIQICKKDFVDLYMDSMLLNNGTTVIQLSNTLFNNKRTLIYFLFFY